MSSKKQTGSYYTPKILSDFLSRHIVEKYLRGTEISVLEPSCGDGQFVSSFFDNLYDCQIENIEINIIDISRKELDKAINCVPNSDRILLTSNDQDYLQSFLDERRSFSLIIGNPPYIKKNNLEESQIKTCEEVHQRAKEYSLEVNSNATIKNIWTAFVEASIMSLDDNGILCFVIPAEILQVKYAKELRALVVDEFDRVEVFAFNELIFEGIQQDVIALIGIKGIQDQEEHGFSFYQVNELDDLKEPRFTEKHSNIHRTTLDKWTNYILTDDELNFIDSYRNAFNPISHYCDKAQVGIVSAANDYFILNNEKLKKNNLNRLKKVTKFILPKGDVTPNVASFNNIDINILKSNNKKVNFLHFPDKPKKMFGKIANKYFEKGEEWKEDKKGELHKRYKMLKRNNWYNVPSVWSSEGMFVKRSHLYPRIFVNNAKVLATDSFYRIDAKKQYDIRKIVFSFYNSLTFVLAELEGRFYGGGVLELTPNEFKELAIPYSQNISNEQFNKLDKMLREGKDIVEILSFTNSILIPQLNLAKLEEIRVKLVNRRIKKKVEDPQTTIEKISLINEQLNDVNLNVIAL